MFSGRRHGHAVGFVDDNDFVVAEDDDRLLKRFRLKWDMLPVVHHEAVPIRGILAHRRSIAERDEALRDSLTPDVGRHLREPLQQVFEDRRRRIIDLRQIKA